MSAFWLRFKANYLEKMHGYPSFSLWIPIALSKIYVFPCVPNLGQKPLYLVGTVLNLKPKLNSRVSLNSITAQVSCSAKVCFLKAPFI